MSAKVKTVVSASPQNVTITQEILSPASQAFSIHKRYLCPVQFHISTTD